MRSRALFSNLDTYRLDVNTLTSGNIVAHKAHQVEILFESVGHQEHFDIRN